MLNGLIVEQILVSVLPNHNLKHNAVVFELSILKGASIWAKLPGRCLPSWERCSHAPYVFQALMTSLGEFAHWKRDVCSVEGKKKENIFLSLCQGFKKQVA